MRKKLISSFLCLMMTAALFTGCGSSGGNGGGSGSAGGGDAAGDAGGASPAPVPDGSGNNQGTVFRQPGDAVPADPPGTKVRRRG